MPKKDDKRIGNQFWKLRSKHGRDKLFATSKLMWDAACEYFQWCDDNKWDGKKIRPYTLTALCLYLDCNTQYFGEFKKNLPEDEEDFSVVIKRIEDIIYNQKFEGASVGDFNHNIIARDLGLKDASSKEISGPGGGPIKGIDVVFIDAEEN